MATPSGIEIDSSFSAPENAPASSTVSVSGISIFLSEVQP